MKVFSKNNLSLVFQLVLIGVLFFFPGYSPDSTMATEPSPKPNLTAKPLSLKEGLKIGNMIQYRSRDNSVFGLIVQKP